MKQLLGVAAIVLLASPVVQASVSHVEPASRLTTTDVKTTPHALTVAAFNFSQCNGNLAKLLPRCNN
jgi:hypothetical protein